MNIQELTERGIFRFRRPMWLNPESYIRIFILNGRHGPWGKLYDRRSQEAIGEPTPQTFLVLGDTTDDYEEYKGEPDRDDADPPAPIPWPGNFIEKRTASGETRPAWHSAVGVEIVTRGEQ